MRYLQVNWMFSLAFAKQCNLVLHRTQLGVTQDSLDHCPMPINADQNHGIDLKCLSMPINIGINARILIGIDQGSPVLQWCKDHSLVQSKSEKNLSPDFCYFHNVMESNTTCTRNTLLFNDQ